jgi:hypothetical protein
MQPIKINEMNEMYLQKRKLYPPLALLAATPLPGLALAGLARSDQAPRPSAPDCRFSLTPHELRRIVAGIVG